MFDSFIMWVRVQGSPCHIAAGSHPVQEAGGHKIVYTGVKFKSCFKVVKNHQPPTNGVCLTIQEKYSLTYLRRTVSSLLKKSSEVKSFGSTGIKQVKMP